MKPSPLDCDERSNFELGFQSLFHAGRVDAFPCDADGHVDLDVLGEPARNSRNSHLYAMALVGRDFSAPMVQHCTASSNP